MDILKPIAAVLILVVTTFFLFLLMPLIGALSGFVVSLFFDDVIRQTLAQLGIDLGFVPLWQVGMTLAFIGSFFKASVHHAK